MPNARELAFLLDEACTRLGICLRPEQRRRLEATPPADPEAFARAVFRAEGLEAASDRRLFRAVRDSAERVYGGGVHGDA